MYTLFRQTDPATSVELVTYCHLLDGLSKQLVTGGASQLRVYRLNPFVLSEQEAGGWTQGTKLECVLSFSFLAPIRALVSARLPSTSRDCLLVSFEEAKLAILAYDTQSHELFTLSLHCFEEEYLRGGFTKDFPLPQLAADPEGRCACILVYGRHLGIVPFGSTGAAGDVFDELETTSDRPSFFSYAVPLSDFEEHLQNVADMCFLHGYYEPTLLFLYEPHQTTAGRIIIRQDTYNILAVSLNIKDKVHAVIWTVSLLPFDCFRCLAAPKPVHGVVIVAANSLIYLNQSVPAYGIALNGCIDGATSFPLKDQMDKKITLDCSAADFISPTCMVICTRKGQVFVLTMLVDNTQVVKGMQLDLSHESVIPCVACSCDDGFYFIGSRLGDSVLLRYWEKNSVAVKVTSDPPVAKKSRDEYGDAIDDLAIYGEVVAVTTVETMRVIEYGFEESDRVLNIGPCKHMAIGGPADIPEPLRMHQMDPIFDLVFACGHDKNGAIVALQRTVRPNIMTSSTIPGALQIWTVGKREGDFSHLFLLVSKEVVTMVLELRDEISELESSGFIMDQRTVAAGDVGEGRFVVQVCPMSVVLLCGFARIQELSLDISFPVSQASICDPFVVLLTENGEILFLQLISSAESPAGVEFLLSVPQIQTLPATAISAYRDTSGHFVVSSGCAKQPEPMDVKPPTSAMSVTDANIFNILSVPKPPLGSITLNDEDALLYGDAPAEQMGTFDSKPTIKKDAASQQRDIFFEGTRFHSSALHDPNTIMPSYWLMVARENGSLEVFTLPDFKLVYLIKKFSLGNKLLYDSEGSTFPEIDRPDEQNPVVRELLMTGIGINNARPYLMAAIQDEIVIYEGFPFDSGMADRLCIRFKRISTPVIVRNERLIKSRRRIPGDTANLADLQMAEYPRLLHYFEGISNYNCGVFISGPYPHWLFLCQGELRVHPMSMDGAVRSFAAFNNANCPQGFLYLTMKEDTMRICQLSKSFEFDSYCPARKIEIGCTVHFVTYLLESHTYAVASSEPEPLKKVVSQVGDEKQFDIIEKEEPNYIHPLTKMYKVQLYSPDTWTTVPGAGELQMEEFEVITVMKEVQLKSESTVSGLQTYLAIGTIYNYGEEVLVRGRMFLVEVIEVVPEPGQPDTKHKLKTVYCKEQKGPVTSMCCCQGYLLTGMGQKVYIWNFKDNELVGISFLDLHFYVHQMVGIRNLALVADMYRSISLIRYQEQNKALSLASRDHRPLKIQALPMGIECLVDNKQLAFLMADEEGNISIFCYQPEAKESLGGQRLIPRGEIYIGARVANFGRVQGHISDNVVENKVQTVNRHVILFGTLDGALGTVVPLPEKVYRRLHMLQHLLSTSTAQMAGLNPRSARLIKGLKSVNCGVGTQANRNVVDGDVVWNYLTLSQIEKQDFAKRLGTNKEQILDDLVELQRMMTHF